MPLRQGPSGGDFDAQSVEFVSLSGNPEAQFDGIEVFAYDMNAVDGQQAPERQVDEGYTWTTRVGPEPTELVVSAWADMPTYGAIVGLRDRQTPIAMKAGARALTHAVVTNIDGHASGETVYAYDVQITVKEIQQLSTGGTAAGGQARPVTGPQSNSPSSDGSPPVRRRDPGPRR